MQVANQRIIELLLQKKLVTKDDIEKAKTIDKDDIIKGLIKLRKIDSEIVADAVAEYYKLERIRDLSRIKPFLDIPYNLFTKYNVFPVKLEGKKLYVAMSDPMDINATDALHLITGYEIVPVVTTPEEIQKAVRKWYESDNAFETAEETEDTNEETIDDALPDSPAAKIVQNIIESAFIEKASDIHIEPAKNKIIVRFRVDGVLKKYAEYPKTSLNQILSRIKVMANMDITERRLPQDGKIRVAKPVRADIRVSTLPTLYGEKAVMRVFNKEDALPKLELLGFNEESMEKIKTALHSPYGMILVTGPTGSGKTTTLYALLSERISEETNIITVEDPPEYEIEGTNQVAVVPEIGLTFDKVLRSILRQDPDIIMVGEIRDSETAKVAVQAALTGHLVLATLHTNDSASAPVRFVEMGVEPYLVASSLTCVIAQRLVRRVCKNCVETYVAGFGSPELDFLGFDSKKTAMLKRGTGCYACGYTGYKGRTVVAEVLFVTKKIRELIKAKASSEDIKEQAVREGMKTLLDDARQKVLQGVTTVEEAGKSTYTIE